MCVNKNTIGILLCKQMNTTERSLLNVIADILTDDLFLASVLVLMKRIVHRFEKRFWWKR